MPFDLKGTERERYEGLGRNVVSVLRAKYELLDAIGKRVEENGDVNKRVVGYVAGFTSQAMSSHKLDGDSQYGFGVTQMTFEGLWGSDVGDKYLTYWLDHADDAECVEGYRLGEFDFLMSFTTGDPKAVRWSECWR